MSHEIEASDYLATRETPWHGLGLTVGRNMTSEEALELSRLGGWDVQLTPAKVKLPNGDLVDIPDQFVTVRGDNSKILGVVGDRYEVVQNEALFDFADKLIDTGDAHIVSAGSLRDNRVVFVTVELDRPVKVADVDFKPYLNVTSSHDGSYAWRAGVSPIVVVCMNTFRMALDESAHEYYIKHTSGVADRIDEARKALQISFDYYDEFETEIQTLIDQDVTDRQFENIISKVFPEGSTDRTKENARERRELVRVSYQTDEAAAPWRGSAWGVMNAVNTWELWEKPVRLNENTPQDRHQARLERQALEHLRGVDSPITARTHKELVKRR